MSSLTSLSSSTSASSTSVSSTSVHVTTRFSQLSPKGSTVQSTSEVVLPSFSQTISTTDLPELQGVRNASTEEEIDIGGSVEKKSKTKKRKRVAQVDFDKEVTEVKREITVLRTQVGILTQAAQAINSKIDLTSSPINQTIGVVDSHTEQLKKLNSTVTEKISELINQMAQFSKKQEENYLNLSNRVLKLEDDLKRKGNLSDYITGEQLVEAIKFLRNNQSTPQTFNQSSYTQMSPYYQTSVPQVTPIPTLDPSVLSFLLRSINNQAMSNFTQPPTQQPINYSAASSLNFAQTPVNYYALANTQPPRQQPINYPAAPLARGAQPTANYSALGNGIEPVLQQRPSPIRFTILPESSAETSVSSTSSVNVRSSTTTQQVSSRREIGTNSSNRRSSEPANHQEDDHDGVVEILSTLHTAKK